MTNWIKCTPDTMPNLGDYVFFNTSEFVKPGSYIYFEGETYFCLNDVIAFSSDEVSHWMPIILPLPPEE